jgi:predicted SAM-dependent methyltransferase
MWLNDDMASTGGEASKCRHRVISYIRGTGLDLGCGNNKIVEDAIGIDAKKKRGTDLQLDLRNSEPLGIFSDNYFDYIFASHLIEDFSATEPVLAAWWKKIKPGGYLILYSPDPDYYPRVGTPGSNVAHKRDLYWQDVWDILKSFGNARKISASRHNNSNEYSWQLIVQKKCAFLKRPRDLLLGPFAPVNGEGRVVFPRTKKTKKECLVIRYGAIGDAIWATPLVRQLKKEGYYVVYNCTPYSAQVLRNNPNIDEFLIQERDYIPNPDLGNYWETIGESFGRGGLSQRQRGED